MLIYGIDARLIFVIILLIIVGTIQTKTNILKKNSCAENSNFCGTLRNYFIIIFTVVLLIGLKLLS